MASLVLDLSISQHTVLLLEGSIHVYAIADNRNCSVDMLEDFDRTGSSLNQVA